jgi:HSP20 family protein
MLLVFRQRTSTCLRNTCSEHTKPVFGHVSRGYVYECRPVVSVRSVEPAHARSSCCAECGSNDDVEVSSMAITRWDPFGEMTTMARDMDRLMSRLGFRTASAPATSDAIAWMPRIDVRPDGDDLLVHADIPGVSPDDVDIEFTDGLLTISGERRTETERDEEGYYLRETSFGRFERSVRLPEGIDPDVITADGRDGVLEVRVPQALEAARPTTRRISVGSSTHELGAEEGGKSEEAA